MVRNLFKISLILVLSILLGGNVLAQGCSQCRMQIESAEGTGLDTAGGINMGIMVLMTIPYIILFFLFRKKIFSFFKEFTAMWKS